MKLLQILYPGLGGHSSVAFSLIEGDESKIMKHHLLGYGIEKPSQTFVEKSNELKVEFESVLKPKGFEIKSLLKVYFQIKKIKPDYIISHSTSVIFVLFIYSIFYNCKWTMVEHQSNHAKSKKDWIYTIFILLLSPKIVYLTEVYKKEILEKFRFLTNRKKIDVISNGINLKKFHPSFSNITKDKIVFSMISRLNSLRDHKTLIYAIYEVSQNIPCELYIAGDGDTKEELMNLVKELKLENIVRFSGVLNEEGIIKLLHQTDIYIHSSLAETLSTSLLQVMACKVPIIATNIQGINNIIMNNENGILFKVKNMQNLLDQIYTILHDDNLKHKIIDNAYNMVVNEFNSQNLFKSYMNLWRN